VPEEGQKEKKKRNERNEVGEVREKGQMKSNHQESEINDQGSGIRNQKRGKRKEERPTWPLGSRAGVHMNDCRINKLLRHDTAIRSCTEHHS
jgi:hypothetical protein